MTPQQKRLLDFVRAYHAEYGRGPTHRELCDALGTRSRGNVNKQLRALADYGFLRRGTEYSGNYVPVEAGRGALAGVRTSDLIAELQRRESLAANGLRR